MKRKFYYLCFAFLSISTALFAQQTNEPTALQKAALDWVESSIDDLTVKLIDSLYPPPELLKYFRESGGKNIAYFFADKRVTDTSNFRIFFQKGLRKNTFNRSNKSNIYKFSRGPSKTKEKVLVVSIAKEVRYKDRSYIRCAFYVENSSWVFDIILEFDGENIPSRYYLQQGIT